MHRDEVFLKARHDLNMRIKRILLYLLTACFLLNQSLPCFAQEGLNSPPLPSEQQNQPAHNTGSIIQGGVNYSELEDNKHLFTGQVEAVPKGSELKMTVSKVVDSSYYLKGDEFFAEVTDDFSTQGGIVIPAGTVAHGVVSELQEKKRLGGEAYLTIKFDYLITPDKRKIPIDASMTTKRNPAVSTAKVVLEDAAYTVAGGVIGGILALNALGLAIASHGYTVAGGAGIGSLIGLTASLIRKGPDVLIHPGDEIKVSVNESLKLPVMSEKALRDDELECPGLDVKIINCNIEKDPFGELNTITLTLHIKNNTQYTFNTFDIALLSDYKNVYYASPFGDKDMWLTKISPNSEIRGNLSFSVENPQKRHWLVFYDSIIRNPVAKYSLRNAKRDIKKVSNKK
ncbi:MAG: hypothetical protein ABSC11_06665 [Smithella sp.]|jgi:hypothetical protein